MHSKDPAKSDAEFQAEFERILEEAERTETAADFTRFVFPSSDYSGKTFAPACCFERATFTQYADFSHATFAHVADFRGATFTQDVIFVGATFTQNAIFFDAKFTQGAEFGAATFTQGTTFYKATFTQNVGFFGATFTQEANFQNTIFSGTVIFFNAKLRGPVRFRGTRFRHDFTAEPGLVFADVKMEHPEQVEFHTTDLGQALFYNTDVSKVDFTLVTWRDRGPKARKERRRSPRFCIFDEDVNLENHPALKPLPDSHDERNYGLIAETYQQLKRNYDAKGDYWTAGHWHYGEMEMKRLHSRFRWRWLRWLSHRFSLVAWYKCFSAYGESYMLPLAWLMVVLVSFGVVYPVTGLQLSAAPSNVRQTGYSSWLLEFFQTHSMEHPSAWWEMVVHGLMTSLSVAGFQRELHYMPSYPWGRLLALFELPLSTTLGGLFALAIRRQFKRS
jgi:uncharacterized protein YjbI with pentapeptide repeats